MGVTELWNILSELCVRKDIKYLRGKRIAVDLSGWVVQAMQCKGLNSVKNPHLRNLFCRVSHLLVNGVHPIFVLEGKVPDLKKNAFKKRNYQGNHNSDNVSRAKFDTILNQCRKLLKSLGVPCIKSSGEAEALCAFLYAKGIVDGVITNDNDAFLYGADTVYRDFSIDPKDPHINMYSLRSDKNKLKLNQQNLVALALLLGCDYVTGVPGIGKDTAMKLYKELKGCDLLQRFQDWKHKSASELFPGYEANEKKKEAHCTRCSHVGSTTKHKKEGCMMCDSKITCYLTDSKNPCICKWHKNLEARQKWKHEIKVYTAAKSIPDFPNEKVIEEYLKFSDEIPDEEAFNWNCPDLKKFQVEANNYFNWTFPYSFDKCFPIITSWQQFKLGRNDKTHTLLYKPIKILKTCIVKGEDCLKVQWIPVDDDHSDVNEETFCTVEFEDRFKESYPNIVKEYYDSVEKSKSQPKCKSKKMTKGPESKKVISESTPIDIKIPFLNIHVSSFEDVSYDSFSEVPLVERIKIFNKFKKLNPLASDIMPSASLTSETVNTAFPTNQNVCDKIFNESNRFKAVLSPKLNGNESFKISYGKENRSSNSANEFAGFINKSDVGRKSFICIEFTDSEDSFDMLPNHENIINKSNRKSVIVSSQKSTELSNFSLNFNRTDSFDAICSNDRNCFLDQPISFCESTPNQITNPKLLYSVRKSLFKKSIHSNSSLSIFVSCSTPVTKFVKSSNTNAISVSNLSTPVPSSFNFSSQKFMPLIFNSSNEYSFCSP